MHVRPHGFRYPVDRPTSYSPPVRARTLVVLHTDKALAGRSGSWHRWEASENVKTRELFEPVPCHCNPGGMRVVMQ